MVLCFLLFQSVLIWPACHFTMPHGKFNFDPLPNVMGGSGETCVATYFSACFCNIGF